MKRTSIYRTLAIRFRLAGAIGAPLLGATMLLGACQDDVRLWIGAHLADVSICAVEGSGNDATVLSLPERTVRLTGFTDEESLIPYPATVYPGYRLLQEYFTLPQKFAFFEVTGLEGMPTDRRSVGGGQDSATQALASPRSSGGIRGTCFMEHSEAVP